MSCLLNQLRRFRSRVATPGYVNDEFAEHERRERYWRDATRWAARDLPHGGDHGCDLAAPPPRLPTWRSRKW